MNTLATLTGAIGDGVRALVDLVATVALAYLEIWARALDVATAPARYLVGMLSGRPVLAGALVAILVTLSVLVAATQVGRPARGQHAARAGRPATAPRRTRAAR